MRNSVWRNYATRIHHTYVVIAINNMQKEAIASEVISFVVKLLYLCVVLFFTFYAKGWLFTHVKPDWISYDTGSSANIVTKFNKTQIVYFFLHNSHIATVQRCLPILSTSQVAGWRKRPKEGKLLPFKCFMLVKTNSYSHI